MELLDKLESLDLREHQARLALLEIRAQQVYLGQQDL